MLIMYVCRRRGRRSILFKGGRLLQLICSCSSAKIRKYRRATSGDKPDVRRYKYCMYETYSPTSRWVWSSSLNGRGQLIKIVNMARLQSSRQDLEFEICDYCNARTQDAEFLPCTHVVCVVCFEEAVTRDSRTGCLVCDETTYEEDPQGELCSLCTEDAVSLCNHCSLYLCEFCEQAHARQKQTSNHTLVRLGTACTTAPDSAVARLREQKVISNDPLPSCGHDNTSFYCENCQILVCIDCKQTVHTEHQVISIKDMETQCFERLQNLLSKTQPLISTLKESIVIIEDVQESIHRKGAIVAGEICQVIDTHIAALHEHKAHLLGELDQIKHHKLQELSLQLDGLANVLEDIHEICDLTSHVLSPSCDIPNPVSAKLSLASQLEELINNRYDYKPQHDDYIHFVPNGSGGIKRGFEMRGIIDVQMPSVSHSFIVNETQTEVKQRKQSSFKLVLVDKGGSRKLNGGDGVDLRVQTSSGTLIKSRVHDKEDGSYELFFTPDASGEHRVSVLLSGKHVKGSPFFVGVRARKKHHGVFHCCTFCSTGGKMHVPCGCGTKIPGGYSGCGHGHEGHPGCFHWSCCGNVEENSDCTL